VLNHRPKTLRGRTLIQVMNSQQRQPARLTALFKQWSRIPEQMYSTSPSLVFAVIGQAKRDGRLTSREENRMLTRLLTHWALKSTVDKADATTAPVAAAA
jgi:hypothetical protein